LTFATLFDGTKIDNPKYCRKSEKKLARLQRRLSRRLFLMLSEFQDLRALSVALALPSAALTFIYTVYRMG